MPSIVAATSRVGAICCDCGVGRPAWNLIAEPFARSGELNGGGLRAALLGVLIASRRRTMPAYQDYLDLASDAQDFAAWTPDSELAATYRRLAGSYYALARFHNQISPVLGGMSDSPATLYRVTTLVRP